MTDRELMQQALDALEDLHRTGDTQVFDMCHAPKLLPALRARLAQPEQEPVWVEVTTNTGDKFILDSAVEADKIRAAKNVGLSVVPLYTKEQMKDIAQKLADCAMLNSAPPQREWQGLTPEEVKEISLANRPYVVDMVVALEKRLKEKNT